jgi:HK97 family phage portal protein
MGLFDRFLGKATASPSALLPPPLIQRQTSYFTGTGNGDFWSLLTRNLPGSNYNWRNQAGDLMLNSIVAIGMDWYIRNWSQGVPVVRRPMPDGQVENVSDHPVIQLLSQPTPNVPPSLVWSWIIPDYQLLGNAYFRKVRVSGRVVGLQYLAADMVRPVGNKVNPLLYYQYTVDGTSYNVALEDMIHIRYGRDPQDSRFGRSPVTSVLREIATDNVAASAAFGMVRHGGMPSMMVGPDYKGGVEDLSEDDARQTKAKLQQDFTGDSAGSVLVMTGPFKVEKVSHKPSEMAFDEIRRKPEERVCAAIGLNPLVLQLGSGLERATYSNLEQATRSAWTDGMIPLMRQMAEALTIALLPDYEETQPGDYLEFDVTNVPALQADLNEDAERAERLYKAGIVDLATAKRVAGVAPSDDDEGYYHPTAVPVQIGDQELLVPDAAPVSTARTADETAKLVGAAGALIRAGFEPEAALQAVGLNPIQHLGLLPVTVRQEETKAFDDASEPGLKFFPSKEMKEEAQRAIEWRDAGRDGGTAVAWARANQIISGEKLSESTVLRMYSFFRRHEVDKQAEGFRPGEEGYPSAGRVAWAAWGGDAGYRWATAARKEILKRMAPKENGKSYHPYYGYELTDADA